MIVIISIAEDVSTNDVIDWILHFEGSFFRINSINDIHHYLTKVNNISLLPNKPENNIESVWYRRMPSREIPSLTAVNNNKDILSFYYSEQQALLAAVYTLIEDKKWLNHWSNSSPGKVHQLHIASNCGLNIPKTRIITSKEELIKFYNDTNRDLIIKPIQDMVPIQLGNEYYFQYTKQIRKKDIENLTNEFFPCLFQEYIDKNLEVRIFYIDNNFFSMAICSTFDKQTKEDFRRYNDKYPNRVIPYKLPSTIEKKLHLFMQEMKLNCGSIDMILDNSGDYYFLEVNPVGQFGMISYPCNYYLEREIANFLLNNKKHE